LYVGITTRIFSTPVASADAIELPDCSGDDLLLRLVQLRVHRERDHFEGGLSDTGKSPGLPPDIAKAFWRCSGTG